MNKRLSSVERLTKSQLEKADWHLNELAKLGVVSVRYVRGVAEYVIFVPKDFKGLSKAKKRIYV